MELRGTSVRVEHSAQPAPLSLVAAWIIANRAVRAQADRLRLLFDDPRRVAEAQRIAHRRMWVAIEGPCPLDTEAALYVLKYKSAYEARRAKDPHDEVTLELGRRIKGAEEYLETRPPDDGLGLFIEEPS